MLSDDSLAHVWAPCLVACRCCLCRATRRQPRADSLDAEWDLVRVGGRRVKHQIGDTLLGQVVELVVDLVGAGPGVRTSHREPRVAVIVADVVVGDDVGIRAQAEVAAARRTGGGFGLEGDVADLVDD